MSILLSSSSATMSVAIDARAGRPGGPVGRLRLCSTFFTRRCKEVYELKIQYVAKDDNKVTGRWERTDTKDWPQSGVWTTRNTASTRRADSPMKDHHALRCHLRLVALAMPKYAGDRWLSLILPLPLPLKCSRFHLWKGISYILKPAGECCYHQSLPTHQPFASRAKDEGKFRIMFHLMSVTLDTLTTLSGKFASSATWIPKLWSHTPIGCWSRLSGCLSSSKTTDRVQLCITR